MKIEVFKTEHLKKINPVGGWAGYEWAKNVLNLSTESDGVVAFTVFDKNIAIGIVGVLSIWDGLGDAFTIISKDIKNHGRAAYEAAGLLVPTIFNSMKLRRLQATVLVGFDVGVKFIENIGFQREGIMKKWTPDGDDVYIYAMVGE